MRRLDALEERIAASPEGRAVLRFLESKNTILSFDPGMECKGAYTPYSRRHRTIELSPHEADDLLIAVLFHEARHALQDEAGYELYCHPDTRRATARWYNRILEADAHAFTSVMCLKLAERGDEGPLRAFRATEDGDVIEAAAAVYALDPAHLDDGQVARAAFDQWFRDPTRLERYDVDADRRLDAARDSHADLLAREIILGNALISLSFMDALDDDSADYLGLASCPRGIELPSLEDAHYWRDAEPRRRPLPPPTPRDGPLVSDANRYRKKPFWEE